ncbi:putative escrt-i component [Golovinomyces cichoracearum]|uniref:Putative escrt-i component n=1 Tax=Golovinomyces cichoracearum TaxID=62708 RepID=A0A420J6A4_9PEZI|nr:putative escrt-i component [Golovinomyces cichoracearum]
MAAVKQQVLDWLYSVLTSEYKNLNRTFNDVAQLLAQCPSLSPRTDVYTYENGTSALLLHISGTIPVVFRGTCYRFPITIWVPHSYPSEAPMVYVIATDGMVIRPGQHVDLQGKVYHPYLVGWAENSDKFNFFDLLAVLQEVFAKEPPVISRPHDHTSHRTLPPGTETRRPVSQLPQKDVQSQPPPPPPKPKSKIYTQQSVLSGSHRYDSAPPLPSLLKQQKQQNAHCDFQTQNIDSFTRWKDSALNYELSQVTHQSKYLQSSPESLGFTNTISHQTTDPIYLSAQQNLDSKFQSSQSEQGSYSQQHQHQSWREESPRIVKPESSQFKSETPPDLLSAPSELLIPSPPSSDCPAPPIPPNPEKDLILQKISNALYSQRQKELVRIKSSIPGLHTQYSAMLASLSKMEAEIHALESLNNLLTSNTNLLHSALREADTVMSSSQHRALPGVDELLIAPNVVANQLYELVSEERSLGDALFVLARAVENGRIGATTFAKITRSLSREWYLKKALVRKIGRGMGLVGN